MSWAKARTFVYGGEIFRFLPRFLSGCVTTAATLCGESMSRLNAGIANSDVPKNIIFILILTLK